MTVVSWTFFGIGGKNIAWSTVHIC
jgi:hypothetical protein